jgi:peptidyl-prolyl cis-trans isomerase D
MLSLMRKRAGSWMIKIILFAIVVVFSFWGVGSMRSHQVTQVAEVNGEAITRTQYLDAYNRLRDNYRRTYGDQLNESVMQMLRPGQQALNQLIDRILMLQEAGRLDLSVADDELAATIQKLPAFQNNGTFDHERYRRVLAQNNTSSEKFEHSYKEELLIDKLSSLILSGVTASEDEALAWYQFNNTEVSLDYVLFAPSRYQEINPDDGAMAAYFKENENQYRTDPQVKVRYLNFDPNAYKSEVSLSDDAVAKYYKDHPEEFSTESTIEARHILLKVDATADAKTVEERKKQAMDIYKLAKAGQDFAKLATQYSEGPSKDKGGYLGTFDRKAMVKPFADKAFAMKAGEISEPVRTDFGWHLIKVEKVNAATSKRLEQVAPQIRDQLVAAKARDLAMEKAEQAYGSVFDGDDLTDLGKTFKVPVHTTEFFSAKGIQQKGIDDPQKFTKIAFGLQKMDISEIEMMGQGYYLMQVFDRREAQIPELSVVSEQVRADLINVRQGERAKADANTFLEKMKQGVSMAEAAAQFKVAPASTGFFKRNGTIPEIGSESQIVQSAFQLSATSPLPDQALQGKQGWYVIQFKERKLPASGGFDKEKGVALKRLTDQKKRDTFQRWVADLKARSTVTINNEQIVTP